MKAQEPARGILETSHNEYGHAYHVECECSSEDHAVCTYIEVEPDLEIDAIEVGFYIETWTPFFENFWSRVKCAYDVLFKGVHKQQHHIILNEQAATNWITAVSNSITELKDNK